MPDPVEWIPVHNSSRIVAEAYLPETETIIVRFSNGTEWQYQACPRWEWEAFTAPGQSRGKYIAEHLDNKPNSRWG